MKRTKRYLFSFLFSLVMLAWLAAFLVGCSQTTATPDTDPQPPSFIEVRTWQDLQNMENDLAANYVQMNDITFPNPGEHGFTNIGFRPIGIVIPSEGINDPFTGSYNGNGYSISNFYINRPSADDVGLFGYVTGANTVIENVRLSISNVTGRLTVGALVGRIHRGTIRNVGVDGNGEVIGQDTVGGLIARVTPLQGEPSDVISIVNAYANVDVTATDSGAGAVGGLIGSLASRAAGVYATGDVTGGAYAGSLVGGLSQSVNNGITQLGTVIGYSTGEVSGTSQASGGLVGIITTGTPITIGYWDEASTGQSGYLGGNRTSMNSQTHTIGISSINNVYFTNDIYEDRQAGVTNEVFTNATFLEYFDLPGASFTWPTLKPEVNQ